MSFYRVAGTLLGFHTTEQQEGDVITLDLIVPGSSATWAEAEARMIAARDYAYLRWAERPVIEEIHKRTHRQNMPEVRAEAGDQG